MGSGHHPQEACPSQGQRDFDRRQSAARRVCRPCAAPSGKEGSDWLDGRYQTVTYHELFNNSLRTLRLCALKGEHRVGTLVQVSDGSGAHT